MNLGFIMYQVFGGTALIGTIIGDNQSNKVKVLIAFILILVLISFTLYLFKVEIEELPEMLRNAFISVEDVRFYKHNGVDFKRLFSAALEILGNSNSSGGSTITQQLIKNKVLGSERTYKRKIQEAFLALQLETVMGKDDILEAYLNDIYLGGSNYGVKAAAKDFFGKELNELIK